MREEDDDLELHNFASAPVNARSALRGNEPLRLRHEALLDELQRKGLVSNEPEPKNLSALLQEEVNSQDSDDIVDNFHSEIWGQGTTKTVADHYKQLHDRNAAKVKNQKYSGSGNAEALNINHFLEVGNLLAKSRLEKQAAKNSGLQESEERVRLELINNEEKAEVEKLRGMLSELEASVTVELEKLRAAQEKKKRDIDFVENAFYTSNEEGMGVSPGTFDEKNRMPRRPGSKVRSPKREI